ncbi:DUF7827 domain-containing protein [Halopenitus persicus]|uniref:DUF7827 domain-containing protein n=1 Tax=Halopenitus persicus TaxID=1048396 RepID=UPI000BBB3F10|nr:hypothetical protein [Halopenitus persicus]
MAIRNRRSRTLLLSFCLLVSAAAVGIGVAGGTAADSAVGFSETDIVVDRGNVATIGIELVNTDEAKLLIQSSDREYRAVLRVHDDNDDGHVGVRFNTFLGANGSDGASFDTASPKDRVTAIEQSAGQSPSVLESGRYNLIVSTGDSRIASVLRLENGSVGDSRSVALHRRTDPVPREPDVPTMDATMNATVDATMNATVESSTNVTVGDVGRVEFDVPSIEGAMEGTPPSERLVFANDSHPGAETTHLIQLSPDENVSDVRSVRVVYDGSSQTVPNTQRISRDGIETIGIDTDRDGRVDRSLKIRIVNIRTSSSGMATIAFDRPLSISESDTFIMAYSTRNPETTDRNGVHVSLASDVPGDDDLYNETDTMVYGPAGEGTLGHGIDLRIQDDDDRIVAPLAGVNTTYNPEAGTLLADLDTDRLGTGEYRVSLDARDHYGFGWDRIAMSENVSIVSPSVTITSVDRTTRSGDEPASVSVDAETNLATGNQVIVRLSTESTRSSYSYLSQCVATVDRTGSISCQFSLPDQLNEPPLSVSVTQNDTMLAGPERYD